MKPDDDDATDEHRNGIRSSTKESNRCMGTTRQSS